MSEWLPIESAPKDGTWVLLTGGHVNESTDPEYDTDPIQQPMVVAKWSVAGPSEDGDWVYEYWDNAWRSAYYEATHWRPLPDLPAGWKEWTDE